MPTTPDRKQKRQPPDYYKGLPASEDAERMVLGSVMVGTIGTDIVARSLRLDDFDSERHRHIFRALLDLHQHGVSIDRVSIAEELKRRRQLSGVGGVTYIASLDDGMPHLAHPETYVEIVRDKGIQRAAIHAADAIAKRVLNGDESTDELLSSGIAALQSLQSRNGHHTETAPSSPQWPEPIRAEGFYGIAGELVSKIEPHTEADSAALLVQFLVGWGSLTGRGPYYLAEADYHHTNEYAVIVGTTSKGRKGTSWGRILHVLERIDPHWVENRQLYGAGSGEALVEFAGNEDSRTLIAESEFARLLAVASREKGTISANLRTAWDKGALQVYTRLNKVTVKNAHVSMLGHITREELRRCLADTETANGFGNRILWTLARRSKSLPMGGGSIDYGDIIQRLKAVTDRSRKLGNTRMMFEPAAETLWRSEYDRLAEGHPGMFGAATSRGEAHVLRLFLIYALLDGAKSIGVEHLRAALAVWDYCEASARFIWGDRLGDPVADELLRVLRAAGASGMTRWEVSNHFGRNKDATSLDIAISLLVERGLIRSESEQTGGRKGTRYRTL